MRFLRFLSILLAMSASGVFQGVAAAASIEDNCDDDESRCDCSTCVVNCGCCPARFVAVLAPSQVSSTVPEGSPLRRSANHPVVVVSSSDIFHPPKA